MTAINSQWELTEDSLSGLGKLSYYHILASRLTEDGNAPFARELYDWPIQIAQKANFDYDLFVQAFREALRYFSGRYQPALDERKLEASITKGREFAEWKRQPDSLRPDSPRS